jgi:peroxiredoxin
VNGVALAARLALGAVFALAAAGKLRAPGLTRDTLEDFGLPRRAAGPGAWVLPLAELATAGLLLFDATAVVGAIAALALLAAFSAAIAVNLARGRRPDCNCFGQVGSAPIGPATLARNAVLALLAVVVLAAGSTDAGATALDDLGDMDTATALALAALVVALATLALGAWTALHLLRQQGRILLRLDALDGRAGEGGAQAPAGPPPGLPVGAPAPAFALDNLTDERVAGADLLADGRRLVLAFVEPGCAPCRALLPHLAERRNGDAPARLAVVITRSKDRPARQLAARHDLPLVLLDPDGTVAGAFGAFGTPMAVAIEPDGLVGSELAAGEEGVRELLDTVAGAAAPGRDPVPDVELADERGAALSLRDAVTGEARLVLFWSATCGHCAAMLDDVLALEAREEGPGVVLVASGDSEGIREQGLRSPLLLDPGFAATAESLGVGGTPSALRVDADGRIASAVAVGAAGVLALAGPAAGEASPVRVITHGS